MNTRSPAISPQSLAQELGRKTGRVQEKLHEAEQEMRTATEELSRPLPEARAAAQHNAQAERKVHEAAEELEVVKAMLEDAGEADAPAARSQPTSGHGAKSLLPLLKRRT